MNAMQLAAFDLVQMRTRAGEGGFGDSPHMRSRAGEAKMPSIADLARNLDVPLEELLERARQVAIDEIEAQPARPWHADLPDSRTLLRALEERGFLRPTYSIDQEIVNQAPFRSDRSFSGISQVLDIRVRRHYLVEFLQLIAEDQSSPEAYVVGEPFIRMENR